jgi:hypothetical protein
MEIPLCYLQSFLTLFSANVEGGEQSKNEICHANIRKHMIFFLNWDAK